MNRKFAAAVLSALLYAQGLLGFAAAAAVLLDQHGQNGGIASVAVTPARANPA